MLEEMERRHAPRLEDAVCDGPQDITRCKANHEISRGVWQMDCEISRSVRRTARYHAV